MIRILPETLVNKIAAGEVIVRPASVVKELVENAIDAGASRILVELANACRDIRVRDDGCGMTRDDLPLALLRHATSKIERFEDLWQLRTRGFRGEALASIAAVARLTILTRPRGELAGARLDSQPGTPPSIQSAGAPEGTDVHVQDLFFNTPVRLKFLKSPASELQAILYMITRQALIRPDIGFSVTHDRRTLLEVPPHQPWHERLCALLGTGLADDLLPLHAERADLTIRGFLVAPRQTRKDRRYQFFYVNGRPITSRTLSSIVAQAYKGLIMTQRFPMVVIDVDLPPGDVDINVHPTKEEVRFRNEPKILGALHRAIQERLASANLLPTLSLATPPLAGTAEQPATPAAGSTPPSTSDPARASLEMPGDFTAWTSRAPATPTSAERAAPADTAPQEHRELDRLVSARLDFEQIQRTLTPSFPAETDSDPACTVHPLTASLAPPPLPSRDTEPLAALLAEGSYPEPLGQVADCYIVARAGDNLLLVDQHAAHERLLYLQLCARCQSPAATQPLLLPLTVDVPPEITPILLQLLPDLARLGLHVEHFGGSSFVVQSVPADLPQLDPGGVLADLVDDLQQLARMNQLDLARDRILTRMACRSAIKAGQKLSLEEMNRLIRDLVDSRMGFTCPHGRPTMILLTRHQLDRQFKRKL